MINSVMSFPCDECKGVGYIFWGDESQYDVEPCDCQEFALGTLFTTPETN
jgi:hypothetical protein